MITVKNPSQLTALEMQVCLHLIREGNSVNIESATAQFPQCKTVALIIANNNILAIGTVKKLRENYNKTIREKSGYVSLEGFELGYVVVATEFRGLGFAKRIVETLVKEYTEQLFAVTSSPTMRRINAECGFNRVGNDWSSVIDTSKSLSLWVR